MPTYTKETALYDTGAIANDITAAGDTADKYITAIDQNGIKVHAENSPNINYSKINADGLEVFKGTTVSDSTSVAKFGDTARVGKESDYHENFTNSAIDFYKDANTKILSIDHTTYDGSQVARIVKSDTNMSEALMLGYDADFQLFANRDWTTGSTTGSSYCGVEADIISAGAANAQLTATNTNNTMSTTKTASVVVSATTTGAYINLDGGVTSISALDDGVFSVTTEDVFSSSSINGNAHKYGTVSITKSKYYPLGIVGWNSPDTSQFVPSRLRLSARATGSATIAYDVRNVYSSSATGKMTADILWLKVTV